MSDDRTESRESMELIAANPAFHDLTRRLARTALRAMEERDAWKARFERVYEAVRRERQPLADQERAHPAHTEGTP